MRVAPVHCALSLSHGDHHSIHSFFYSILYYISTFLLFVHKFLSGYDNTVYVLYLWCVSGEAILNVTLNATSQARGRLLLYHMEDWRDASEDNDCVRRLGKARVVCESILFWLILFSLNYHLFT